MERKILEVARKWAELAQAELNCYKDMEYSLNQIDILDRAGVVHYKELSGDRGIVAYVVIKDFLGDWICSELFIYVRPEHRGSIRTFKEIIEIFETAAKENCCKFVKIGSNIGYRDEKYLALLSRFGYSSDTVKNEMV